MALVNPGINPGKCKHPYKVENLNPGRQIPPQITQPTDLSIDMVLHWTRATTE
jgi:hypothetical protein